MISVTFNIRVGTLYANRVRVLSSVEKRKKGRRRKKTEYHKRGELVRVRTRSGAPSPEPKLYVYLY